MWTYCRCLIYGSYTILIHLCEVDGKLPFSSASTVLVTEVLKVLFFSVLNVDNVSLSVDSIEAKMIGKCQPAHGGKRAELLPVRDVMNLCTNERFSIRLKRALI